MIEPTVGIPRIMELLPLFNGVTQRTSGDALMRSSAEKFCEQAERNLTSSSSSGGPPVQLSILALKTA